MPSQRGKKKVGCAFFTEKTYEIGKGVVIELKAEKEVSRQSLRN